MTLPGVGPVVALTYGTAVDDPTRFRSCRDVGAWAGYLWRLSRPVAIRRNQSGERDISSGITKVGDGELRKVLVQAATVRLHRSEKNCALKAWALRGAPSRHKARSTAGDDCACTPYGGGIAPHGTGWNPVPVHPHSHFRVRSRRNGSRTILKQLRRPLGWASTPAPRSP